MGTISPRVNNFENNFTVRSITVEKTTSSWAQYSTSRQQNGWVKRRRKHRSKQHVKTKKGALRELPPRPLGGGSGPPPRGHGGGPPTATPCSAGGDHRLRPLGIGSLVLRSMTTYQRLNTCVSHPKHEYIPRVIYLNLQMLFYGVHKSAIMRRHGRTTTWPWRRPQTATA